MSIPFAGTASIKWGRPWVDKMDHTIFDPYESFRGEYNEAIAEPEFEISIASMKDIEEMQDCIPP